MANSFLDLAYEVLKTADKPLTCHEIWITGSESADFNKVKTTGKTPEATLGSRLYVDVKRNNPISKFVSIGSRPMRFFLKERESALTEDIISKIELEDLNKPSKTRTHYEIDLHPLLTYFAFSAKLKRNLSITTKTISDKNSKKSGFSQWTNPDMVGFYLPKDWQSEVNELNRLSDNNSLRLYSFELKRYLDQSNYREAFFQAVSNSSWAHEGYLVAADISKEVDLLDELERLSASFGIGIINLDLNDFFDGSKVLYPAHRKEFLDWETINKLCEQSPDFKEFLSNVKIDFASKSIHMKFYDDILEEPTQYIAKIRGITSQDC